MFGVFGIQQIPDFLLDILTRMNLHGYEIFSLWTVQEMFSYCVPRRLNCFCIPEVQRIPGDYSNVVTMNLLKRFS